MSDEMRKMAEELGMKTYSLEEILESDQEIPYITLDNIGAILDQLELDDEKDSTTVVLSHKSADGKKSQWRSKVFLTGAPCDMDCHFDDISKRIISHLGCDVYYYDDDISPDQEHKFDLLVSQTNYMVLLVSKALFAEGSRAYELDLQIASDYDIPVLPILIDKDVVEEYNDKIGSYELLDIDCEDFDSRLRSFFSSQEVNGELVARIKKAFPKRIFLSYRKKDYQQANVLLDTLRDNADFADVSIWYDSYLVPGEDYNDEIKEAILDADVVLLLVTPNIVEEGNYVQKIEYPLAKQAERPIPVVPVALTEVDAAMIEEHYPDLGNIYNLEEVYGVLSALLPQTKELTAEQELLIGLSYLYGIVSERDLSFASEFLFKSAYRNNCYAVEKLWGLTNNSAYVRDRIADLVDISENIIATYTERFEQEDFADVQNVVGIAIALQAQYLYYKQLDDATRIAEFLLKYIDYISIRKVERYTALARTYFRLASAELYRDLDKATTHIEKSLSVLKELEGDCTADFPSELYVTAHTMAMQIYRRSAETAKAYAECALLYDFTAGVDPSSPLGEQHGYLNFAAEYLQLLEGSDHELSSTIISRGKSMLESFPIDSLSSTIASLFYSVSGLFYHEYARDPERAIECFISAYEATKHADFALHAQTAYYALCKSCIDLASCYTEIEAYGDAKTYYEEALTICRDNDFHKKYPLYKEAVSRYANILVMYLEDPYQAMMLYDEVLQYISDNKVQTDSVIFDIPNFNFRIGYLLGNYFDNQEGKVAYMTRAKQFLGRVVAAYGEATPEALLDLYDHIQSELGEE